MRFTFQAGLVSDTSISVLGSSLPVDDSQPEPIEGFVLHLEFNNDDLDSRDLRRVRIERRVILVSILDDGGISSHMQYHCELTVL